jgi:uncharacterized protein YjiK
MNHKCIWLLPITLSLVFFSCKQVGDKYTSPKGYDLQNPERFSMPESLLEISGITFNQGKADTVYSVQDEDGRLFKQAWGVKKQSSVKFAKNGDYEDLAIAKKTVFVLKSSGSIYSFPLAEAQVEKTNLTKEWKNLLPKEEFEGIYANEVTQQLFVLCKECGVDKKLPTASGYILNIQDSTEIVASGTFSIDLSPLKTLGHEVKKGLKASALSKHRKTGDWFILSSANKLLIIAGADWKIKEVHRLNSSIFNQPEGICFDTENNLYISNEGDELKAGNILKIPYKSLN